jgi:hypothetical protein
MTKTDRQLRKFVKALLKYSEDSEDSEVFNPDFTVQEIPKIFKNWTELDFNMVHHGAGTGCCTYIGSEKYKINKDHCNNLQNKFKDSDRTKWRLIVAVIVLLVAIVGLLLNYCRNNQ